jgi:hypothetical protein
MTRHINSAGQQRLLHCGPSDPDHIGSSCIPFGRRRLWLKQHHVVRQHLHHLPRRKCRRLAAASASRGARAPAAPVPAAAPAPSVVVRWRCPTCGRPLLPASATSAGDGGGTAAHGPAAGAGPAMLRCAGGHAVSVARQGHVNLLPAGRLQPKHAAAAGDDEAMVGPCLFVHVITVSSSSASVTFGCSLRCGRLPPTAHHAHGVHQAPGLEIHHKY